MICGMRYSWLRGCRRGRIPSSAPSFFFFNDTATTEIYTLSLLDALPIYAELEDAGVIARQRQQAVGRQRDARGRSEEHTSELQSPCNLVCRLLLEKKK